MSLAFRIAAYLLGGCFLSISVAFAALFQHMGAADLFEIEPPVAEAESIIVPPSREVRELPASVRHEYESLGWKSHDRRLTRTTYVAVGKTKVYVTAHERGFTDPPGKASRWWNVGRVVALGIPFRCLSGDKWTQDDYPRKWHRRGLIDPSKIPELPVRVQPLGLLLDTLIYTLLLFAVIRGVGTLRSRALRRAADAVRTADL